MTIMDEYRIHRETLAIVPASAIDHYAIALEATNTKYVKQTPLEIIQLNCLKSGASYQGRRRASQHLLKRKQKLPIIINERPAQYAFPTQSPRNYQCSWIIANHILTITDYSQGNNSSFQTTIHFRQQRMLDLVESPYQIKQQYLQALALHQILK